MSSQRQYRQQPDDLYDHYKNADRWKINLNASKRDAFAAIADKPTKGTGIYILAFFAAGSLLIADGKLDLSTLGLPVSTHTWLEPRTEIVDYSVGGMLLLIGLLAAGYAWLRQRAGNASYQSLTENRDNNQPMQAAEVAARLEGYKASQKCACFGGGD